MNRRNFFSSMAVMGAASGIATAQTPTGRSRSPDAESFDPLGGSLACHLFAFGLAAAISLTTAGASQTPQPTNPHVPETPSLFDRIENRWQPDRAIHINGTLVAAGAVQVGSAFAQWNFEEVDRDHFRIRNREQNDIYLHNESGPIEAGQVEAGWWSAQWKLLPVPGTTNFWIQNRWKPDEHLHIQNGALEAGAIEPGWVSAQWSARPVGTATSLVLRTPRPESPHVPPEATRFDRIENRWKPEAVHNQNGPISSGSADLAWWSANWTFEPIAGTEFYRIRNRWRTDEYLHRQSAGIEAGPIKAGWFSAQWRLVPVANTDFNYIENRWMANERLHIQNGRLEVGVTDPNWFSAQWNIKAVTPISSLAVLTPPPENPHLLEPPPRFDRIHNRWKTDEAIHVQDWPVVAGASQPGWWSAQWAFEKVDGTEYFRIRNRWKTSEYLHNQSGGIESGQVDANWWSAQWKLLPVTDTRFYSIQNRWKPEQHLHNQNGRLEVGPVEPGWWSANWTINAVDGISSLAEPNPQLTEVSTAVATKWPELAPPPVRADRPVQIRLANDGSCIEYDRTLGASTLKLGPCTGGVQSRHLLWSFRPVDDEYHQVVSTFTGECLSVKDASTEIRAEMTYSACAGHSDANQLWKLVAVGDEFRLMGKRSKKCMISSGGDNKRPILWTCGRLSTQETFTFPVVGTLAENGYSIHGIQLVAGHSRKCVEVDNPYSVADGVNTHQWGCVGGPQRNQVFSLQSVKSRGEPWYTIRASHSGRCLAVDGSNVSQSLCKDTFSTDPYRFRLVRHGDLFQLQNKSGKCLEVSGAGRTNGSDVRVANCGDASVENQLFDLRPTVLYANKMIPRQNIRIRSEGWFTSTVKVFWDERDNVDNRTQKSKEVRGWRKGQQFDLDLPGDIANLRVRASVDGGSSANHSVIPAVSAKCGQGLILSGTTLAPSWVHCKDYTSDLPEGFENFFRADAWEAAGRDLEQGVLDLVEEFEENGCRVGLGALEDGLEFAGFLEDLVGKPMEEARKEIEKHVDLSSVDQFAAKLIDPVMNAVGDAMPDELDHVMDNLQLLEQFPTVGMPDSLADFCDKDWGEQLRKSAEDFMRGPGSVLVSSLSTRADRVATRDPRRVIDPTRIASLGSWNGFHLGEQQSVEEFARWRGEAHMSRFSTDTAGIAAQQPPATAQPGPGTGPLNDDEPALPSRLGNWHGFRFDGGLIIPIKGKGGVGFSLSLWVIFDPANNEYQGTYFGVTPVAIQLLGSGQAGLSLHYIYAHQIDLNHEVPGHAWGVAINFPWGSWRDISNMMKNNAVEITAMALPQPVASGGSRASGFSATIGFSGPIPMPDPTERTTFIFSVGVGWGIDTIAGQTPKFPVSIAISPYSYTHWIDAPSWATEGAVRPRADWTPTVN